MIWLPTFRHVLWSVTRRTSKLVIQTTLITHRKQLSILTRTMLRKRFSIRIGWAMSSVALPSRRHGREPTVSSLPKCTLMILEAECLHTSTHSSWNVQQIHKLSKAVCLNFLCLSIQPVLCLFGWTQHCHNINSGLIGEIGLCSKRTIANGGSKDSRRKSQGF
jgi:hypothetical protein